MKRLTTLALLAGMLSAPALHSEEPGSGSAAPLSFPQLNDKDGKHVIHAGGIFPNP
ncbi:hypothetical protein ACQR7K_03590, partial [Klebsiella pneumoniae]